MNVFAPAVLMAVDECADRPALLRWVCRADAMAADAVSGLAGWWSRGGLPVAWAVVLLLVAAGFVWVRRIAADWSAVAGAAWVEVTPPAGGLPADTAAGLVRLLVGFLRRGAGGTGTGAGGGVSGWWGPAPRLALEWWADPAGTRIGVWVPATLNADRVAATVRRGWPGARVRVSFPPPGFDQPPAVGELLPDGDRWAPLIDPTPGGTSRFGRPGGRGVGSVRAVLDALSWRRPGETACVQFVITRARGSAAGAGVGLVRAAAPVLIGTLAGALATVGLFVVDMLTPGTQPAPFGGGRTDRTQPGIGRVDADAAAAEAKRAARPHVRVTARVAVAVVGRRWREHERRQVARGLVADIASGYCLVATHTPLRTRWRRRLGPIDLPARVAGAGFVATLAEVGALWQLPEDAASYNLPRPGAADRRAQPGLPHLDRLPGQPARRARPDRRDVDTAPLPLPPAKPADPAGPGEPTDPADGSAGPAGRAVRDRRRAPAHPPGHPSAPGGHSRRRAGHPRRRPDQQRPDQRCTERPRPDGPGMTDRPGPASRRGHGDPDGQGAHR